MQKSFYQLDINYIYKDNTFSIIWKLLSMSLSPTETFTPLSDTLTQHLDNAT